MRFNQTMSQKMIPHLYFSTAELQGLRINAYKKFTYNASSLCLNKGKGVPKEVLYTIDHETYVPSTMQIEKRVST